MTIEYLCCEAPKAEFYFIKNNYKFYLCRSCDFVFVYPKPDSLEIYSQDYFTGANNGFGFADYEADKKAMISTFESYLNAIEKFLPAKGKILDVGAATGIFLQVAQKRGWQATGIEPSSWAAQQATAKGLDVKNGTLAEVDFEEKFNVITFFDVLEHIFNPGKDLELAHGMLANQGLMAINVPNSKSLIARVLGRAWYSFIPPEHLSYFNADNLSKLLKKNGFEILWIDNINKKFTFQYCLLFLGNATKISMLKKMSRMIKGSWIGEFYFYLNSGDNLFVIAKKND